MDHHPHWTIGQEYDTPYWTEAEAKAECEKRSYGSIVHWVPAFNGPSRFPDWKSCSMQTWDGKTWSGVNIHC